MAEELSDNNFDQLVTKATQPVLVDFWAPWCGPCRMISPIIEKLGQEYQGKVKVYKLNTDDNPGTSTQFRVQAIPSLLFFKEGKMVEHMVGVQSEKEIRQKLDNLLK